MAKPQKQKEPERTDGDAWARFERTVDRVMKAPPKHRTGKPGRPKRKGHKAD